MEKTLATIEQDISRLQSAQPVIFWSETARRGAVDLNRQVQRRLPRHP
jgi:hypothetical protein